LAAAVGTTGNTLSSINSGNRRLGHDLGARLAAELGVSVLELGAPEAEVDEEGRFLVRRLEELQGELDRERRRFERFVRATSKRLAALEADQAPLKQRSARPPRGATAQ
jgi:hypothetical protein